MNVVIEKILETRLVGIIRMAQYTQPAEVAHALVEGGIQVLEFSLTGANALAAISAVGDALGTRAYVGAGTVRTVEDVNNAADSGATFIVTPAYNRAVLQACRQRGLPVLCGALTPTEMMNALQDGADLIKLFPARLGGPKYVKDLLGPFPDFQLVPTGGVSAENARDYLDAGAVAVALGSSLVPKEAVANRQFGAITRAAAVCVRAVARE